MQTTFALAALAAVAYAAPSPQGVTADIPAPGYPPAGAATSYPGPFEVTIVSAASTKRDLTERQAVNCGQPGYLTVTLTNGVLTDAEGRTGYIAANFQFQFDSPPQTGAIYTGGFSVFPNTSLALGSSAVFWECASGGFSNLYNTDWAAQCNAILIDILPCGSTGVVSETADGQPQATTTVPPPVTQIGDGQPQGVTNPPTVVPVSEFHDGQPQVVSVGPKPVSQISDGQVQNPTGGPVSQISDGQVQATTSAAGVPVSQISDGQVQATTSAAGVPVSQISDGQVQATTSAAGVPVSQISDGQVQATTSAAGVPVSQISDGQVQATTSAAGVPVSQISDGQVQATTKAPTATGAPVSQISDGQVQATTKAPNATTSSPPPAAFTGAGNGLSVSFAALVMGLAAMLLL